ncbi:CHASE3 domain-containing protein [Luteolibacter sp. SL250]|uniref:sensor histidine kinase n=1 Tax=Luteolibacter sp. SL250 TaxID=2995170 RepID=UPI002270F123|nr:CHASE3 domain-containing protein [Luteolibacter sp. SL250]WAC18452.1 CHASE3 domain-containing protein [Luteolibacter sp. SL250]
MPQRARKVRTRYLASALVVLVMIGCGVITSALNTRRNLEDARRVSHSRSVLTALQSSLSAMQDLELGQRGYIIVGEEQYLEPYHHSLGVLDSLLAEVEDLSRGNPEQLERSRQLRLAADRKKAYLARTIEIRRTQGEAEVSRISATGEGKLLMDSFRQRISEMERVEEQLLIGLQRSQVHNLTRTNLIVAVTGGAAVLSTAIGVLILFFYLRNQERIVAVTQDKDRAVQSDKAKSEFLAMMSHEIRTPMNAILGFGELLEDSLPAGQQKQHAQAILSSGNALLELINDILDLSKIEASKLDIRPVPADVRRFIGNLGTLFSYRASEKGIDYRVTVQPEIPSVLVFDALRLRQIMVNLIGNALKFTREGHVHVGAVLRKRGDDPRDWLVLTVSDTGIGIAEDQLEVIFEPFYQVDSRNSRDFQGTGLGLNISERLAEALGGDVTVESVLGHGSTFTLSIPVTLSDSAPETVGNEEGETDSSRLAPGKILIADDVPLKGESIRSHPAAGHQPPFGTEVSLQDPAGLAGALAALLASPWPELVKLVPAQATISFADRISVLASRHGSVSLRDYAVRLREAATTFDLETAGRHLDEFPEIVKSHLANDA